MPRSTLSRRSLLQTTTGAALAAPIALAVPETTEAHAAPATPVLGPERRLAGILAVTDESPVPTTLHPATGCRLDLAIATDGRATLTVGHFDGTPGAALALPADVARELDRQLFDVERASERRIREKRAAGYLDCPMCDAGRYPCRADLCDEHHLVHPSAITRHLGPWFGAREVRAELHRVPPAWGAAAEASPYWVGGYAERLAGTSEDGRVEGVEIRLHGLGWGALPTDPGDCPWGPSIDLWPRDGTHHVPGTDLPIEWCAFLPGDPVHGGADTIAEAVDQAVASIERRLGGGLAVAA